MPNTPISTGLQSFANEGAAINQADTSTNPNSAFVINPGNGQFVSNPGFMNQLQQFELYLQQNPQAAATLQAEESNAQNRQTIIPTADLQNYRNQQGQAAPYGTTYGQAASMGYVPQTAAQQQQNIGIQNAESAIGTATNASNGVSQPIVALGDLLSKIGLGSVASILPGYNQYQQAIGGLQQNSYSSAAAPIFGNQGVTPSQSPGAALPTLLGNLGVIQQGNNGSNPPASPSMNSNALQPVSAVPTNPYNATENSVIAPNPAQLGANARSTQNL